LAGSFNTGTGLFSFLNIGTRGVLTMLAQLVVLVLSCTSDLGVPRDPENSVLFGREELLLPIAISWAMGDGWDSATWLSWEGPQEARLSPPAGVTKTGAEILCDALLLALSLALCEARAAAGESF
jgi:hypothetical protein